MMGLLGSVEQWDRESYIHQTHTWDELAAVSGARNWLAAVSGARDEPALKDAKDAGAPAEVGRGCMSKVVQVGDDHLLQKASRQGILDPGLIALKMELFKCAHATYQSLPQHPSVCCRGRPSNWGACVGMERSSGLTLLPSK